MPDTVVKTRLDELEEDIQPIFLPGSLDALTVGRRRADQGYEFHWKPFHRVPIFRRPTGEDVDVDCVSYVPIVRSTVSPTTVVPIALTNADASTGVEDVGAAAQTAYPTVTVGKPASTTTVPAPVPIIGTPAPPTAKPKAFTFPHASPCYTMESLANPKQPSVAPQVFDIGDHATTGDTDPESEHEAFVRRRATVKPIKIAPPQAGAAIRAQIMDIYVVMEASSNRRRKRTIAFIKGIEGCTDPSLLTTVSSRWEAFDTELLTAVQAAAPANLKRDISNKPVELEKEASFMTGRLAFRMLFQLHQVDMERVIEIDLKALWNLEVQRGLGDLLGWP